MARVTDETRAEGKKARDFDSIEGMAQQTLDE
jgi:hypothetical protein